MMGKNNPFIFQTTNQMEIDGEIDGTSGQIIITHSPDFFWILG
jgi:hypothetical protein